MRRLSIVTLAPLLGACFLQQKLDPEATSETGLPAPSAAVPMGGPAPISGAGGPTAMAPEPGGMPVASAPPADRCEALRSKAHKVLEVNCSFCHQAPATLGGSFNFILDFELLSTAISTAGTRFTVPGDPDKSRLYQRASAGEMPPPGRMPRPSQDDIAVLRDWIASCPIAGPGAPKPVLAGADAGPPGGPGPGCGNPGQECCLASSCNAGGCCVQGQCRGNGSACGDGPGRPGIAGTCMNSSCQNGGNVSCGSLGQPCCDDMPPTCTAPRATCGGAPMTCQACGGDKQPCCASGGVTTCSEGLGCLDVGFGRTGTCQPCGGMGQRCCGSGPITQRTCNGNLTCQPAGILDRCGP